MYSPKSIANFFLALAERQGERITPMKLQKLVYYAHGWYAGYTAKPLINENVEAWQYGPVIPTLYQEFKRFGAQPIVAKATEYDLRAGQFVEVPQPQEDDIRSFLSNVWSSYGKYTGGALSEMTHASGSPWHETWRECGGLRGTDIPFPRIAAHFKEVADRANGKGNAAS